MSGRKSVSASLEAKFLEVLRGLVPDIPAVGFLEATLAGEQKQEDPTSIRVKVDNFSQSNEATCAFSLSVEIGLRVEQAESASGGLFLDAHERIALWLEQVMLGDACVGLGTAEAHVDGFRRTGDDKNFNTTNGDWIAVWTVTLWGRIKPSEEQETNQ